MGKTSKRNYHHGDLASALISSAIALLEEEGEAALSLRAVARRAGVSQAAPYHHFRDKDALLASVAAQGFRRLSELMHDYAAALPDGSAGHMRELGVGYVVFAYENPALFRLMFGASARNMQDSAELAEAGGTAYGMITEASRASRSPAAGADSDVDAATFAAWALVHGLANLLIDGRGGPVAAAIIGTRHAEPAQGWTREEIARLARKVMETRIV